VNRYLEVDFHTRDVERELARLDSPERKELETLFLRYLSEAIDLDRENDLIFRGIESFREGNEGSIEKMEKLVQRYREKKGREYEKVEKDALAEFEKKLEGLKKELKI
jgi:hypothetical protein